MARFYETNPNRIPGIPDKTKPTPLVNDYTIVLLVLTLSATETTVLEARLTDVFSGGVKNSNGSFRPFEESGWARISGLPVDSLIMVAKHFFC